MKQTGQVLKNAREEAGLSLHEVSLSLKISSRIIQAMEEADESKLPAKTFLRGFVKSYVNLLKLNENDVMSLFYSEVGSTAPKLQNGEPAYRRAETVDVSRPKPDLKEPIKKTSHELSPDTEGNSEAGPTPAQNPTPNPTDEKSFAPHVPHQVVEPSLKPIDQNKSPKTAIFTVISVILVILILVSKQIVDRYAKEIPDAKAPLTLAEVETLPPTTTTDTSAPLTSEPNAPLTTTDPNAIVPISPVLAPVTAAVEPKVEAPITPATENEAKKELPQVVVPEGKPIELIVEALESVEIEYSSKSGKRSTIKLTPEQVHTFKSKNGLNVFISNGGAVNLILNGRDLGIPGDPGKSIKLSY